MDTRTENRPDLTPPSLGELFAGYLKNTDAAAQELRPGLVEPYDSGVSHPVDARLAWQGPLASLVSVADPGAAFERPAEWASLVQAHESCPAVTMAAGNYPQLMRDLPGLLQADNLADLLRAPVPADEVPGLASWAARLSKASFGERMLAAGVLRFAGQFQEASALLREEQNLSELQFQVLQNERAALAWSQGDCASAVQLWQKLPRSSFSQFNLGMAMLFEKPNQALPFLQAAVHLLADEDPWRHLAGIYLAIAEMRA